VSAAAQGGGPMPIVLAATGLGVFITTIWSALLGRSLPRKAPFHERALSRSGRPRSGRLLRRHRSGPDRMTRQPRRVIAFLRSDRPAGLPSTTAFDVEHSCDATRARDRFATIAIARASVDHVAASGARQKPERPSVGRSGAVPPNAQPLPLSSGSAREAGCPYRLNAAAWAGAAAAETAGLPLIRQPRDAAFAAALLRHERGSAAPLPAKHRAAVDRDRLQARPQRPDHAPTHTECSRARSGRRRSHLPVPDRYLMRRCSPAACGRC
jgi:hypothetical protein